MADSMNYKALHQLMQNRLDDGSLYILCEYIKFDAPAANNLDSSSLEGNGVAIKSMSLIRYCRQRQILHTLIENLHLVRPDMVGDSYTAWLTWATAQDNPQAPAPIIPPAPPSAAPILSPAKRRLRDELFEELYPELESAMDGRDWDMAISHGQEILALKPDHQPTKDKLKVAYCVRGIGYRVQGMYEQALADYNQAIRLDPNFAFAYIDRGNLYLAQKQYKQALADFNQTILLDSNFASAYNGRGDTYRRKGDRARAIADYVRALELGDEKQRRRAEQALKELGVR